jgi:hypothetical protein
MGRPAHEEKSMSTLTPVTYETVYKKVHAPKNLHLEIDVRDEMAYVYCQEAEHVGTHKNRKITFLANRACMLEFDYGDKVFGQTELKLEAGREETLFVKDNVEEKDKDKDNVKQKEVWTHCAVKPLDGTRVPPMEHKSPPRIVVP